jgi:hypothetical protein
VTFVTVLSLFDRIHTQLAFIRYRFPFLSRVSGTITFYSLPFSLVTLGLGHNYLLFVTVFSSYRGFRARLPSIRYRFPFLPCVSGTITFYSLPFSLLTAVFGHDYLLFVTVFPSCLVFRARLPSIRYRFLFLPWVSGTISFYSLPFSLATLGFGHD